jgi:hypothetical protein
MIVEYIRYELNAHTPEELISAYAEAAASLKASPECPRFAHSLAIRRDPHAGLSERPKLSILSCLGEAVHR